MNHPGLNVCILQNLYVEILTLDVMILGDRAFRRLLSGHEGGVFMNEISAQTD